MMVWTTAKAGPPGPGDDSDPGLARDRAKTLGHTRPGERACNQPESLLRQRSDSGAGLRCQMPVRSEPEAQLQPGP